MRTRRLIAAVLTVMLLGVAAAAPAGAAPPSSLTLNPSSVTGGNSSTATVTLSAAAPSGGTVVTLSDNSTSTSVPTSVTVTAGNTSRSFTVTTSAVTAVTTSTITATADGGSRNAVLTVNPPKPAAPTLVSPASDATVAQPVTFDWNDVANATSYEIQIDNSSTISSPYVASQTVTSSQASITGLPAERLWWRVRAQNAAGVYSSYSTTRRFTALAAPAAASLSSLSVAPSSVQGGSAATGTVTLTSGAPTGGAVVTLTTSNAAVASGPTSLTIPAGATSATFALTTTSVGAQTAVTLAATFSGVSRTATLTVTPPGPAVPALSFVALSHTMLDQVGNNAVGEVRLVSPTSTPVVVTVTSSHPSIARVTLGDTAQVASVQVEPGFDQAVFLVRHVTAVTTPTVVTITASANGVTKTTQITINPTPVMAFSAPTITMGPGFVGSQFVDTATGNGTTVGVYPYVGVVSFDIVAGQLPAGLSLVNPGAGGATPDFPPLRSVVGIPTTVETRSFTLRATDQSGATATTTITITISPALGLSITPQLPWTPVVGAFSNLWVTGSGGVRPYTWVRTAGQFPPGMSLVQDNPDGPLVRITGTPTASGTFNFTLRVTDAQGATGIQALTVTVNPA